MKKSPFDWVKSINHKTYMSDLSGYNPFLTNRSFAYHMDTILLAEEMNQFHNLGPSLQYDFYYYSVRKGNRFGFPPKPQEDVNLELVSDYFQCSKQKAIEYLRVLTTDNIDAIVKSRNIGGQ